MKLFFYTHEQIAPFDEPVDLGEQLFFSNHPERMQNVKEEYERIKNAERKGTSVIIPNDVSSKIVSLLESKGFCLSKLEKAHFIPQEVLGDEQFKKFIGEISIVAEYEVTTAQEGEQKKKKLPSGGTERIGYNPSQFTLTGQWELFVTGVSGFLEPVYLAAFVGVFISIVIMVGLKQNTADAINKVEGYLQQGQIKEAQSESQKLEELDKRRLLIAIQEATMARDTLITIIKEDTLSTSKDDPVDTLATKTAQPKDDSATTPAGTLATKTTQSKDDSATTPVSTLATTKRAQSKDILPPRITKNHVIKKTAKATCTYSVKAGDTLEKISKKFSRKGSIEVQLVGGKKVPIKDDNNIQPGYLLVIDNPVNHNDCNY